MTVTTPPSPPVPPSMPPRVPPPRDVITPAMLDALRATRPWVRFLGVFGFVLVGLMALLGIGVAIAGVFGLAEGPAGFMLIGMGVLYFLFGALYVFPSLYLTRYAKSIAAAMAAPVKTLDLEQALRSQKSFWKFAGILTLVMLVVYIPGVLLAIAIPNFITAKERAKQEETVTQIRSIGQALATYASDNDGYPAAESLADLASYLEPTYLEKLPLADGWGRTMLYTGTSCDGDVCEGYLLASKGRDGYLQVGQLAEYEDNEPMETTNFDADIVVANGYFLMSPQGVE